MRAYNIIIFSLIFLGSWELGARSEKSALGRFARSDSSYEYRRRVPTNPDTNINQDDDQDDDLEEQSELEELQDKGGLIIKGFPEGCAYATMNEPLPGHFLGFGRISFMGSSWAFEYMRQTRPGPFQIAEVAQNLGLIGQNPEQNISVDLMSRTSGESFVVAQLLDRSDLGLGPIVTCISPVFRGRLRPGRPIVYGKDYWTEYDRFIDYRRDPLRRNRWNKWQNRWREDGSQDWRRAWRERKDQRDKHSRPILRPRPRPNPDENTRPKPPIVRAQPKADKNTQPTQVLRPRPKPEPDNNTKPRPVLRPWPKPDDKNIKPVPTLRPPPTPEIDKKKQPAPELKPGPGLDRDQVNRRAPKINRGQKVELDNTNQEF